MSTDNLLLLTQMQQMWPGIAAGSASAAEAAGGDPAEFLQTLLQRMQTATVPATEAIESAASTATRPTAPGVREEVSVDTLVERLKTLITAWSRAPEVSGDAPAAADAGKDKAATGKSLPAETDTPAGLPLAAGAEQWLQDLIQRVVPPPQQAAVPREDQPAAEPSPAPVSAAVAETSPPMGSAPANRAVAELVQMLRAAGLPVDDALAAQPVSTDPAAAAVRPEATASEAAANPAVNSAVGAWPKVEAVTAPVVQRPAAMARPMTDAVPIARSADARPVDQPQARDAGLVAGPQAAVDAAEPFKPTVAAAPLADPAARGDSGAQPVTVRIGRVAAQPASARAESGAEPVALYTGRTVALPAADQPHGGGALQPNAEPAAVAVTDPVIARLLQRAPEAGAETGEPVNSEPVAEAAAKEGLVKPAVVVPAKSNVARPAKAAAGDAKNLSGLERLASRSGTDAEALAAAVGQAPAAAREELVAAADSAARDGEPVPVRAGLAGEAVAAAETKPATIVPDKLQAQVQVPLQHPKWPQQLGERVNWLASLKDGIQTAEIKLNPAHLGPLEVRVNLNQDQASIQFVSHHAAVREAIESAVPKLREMLGEQNLNLVDVNVSQQSFGGDQRQPATAQFDFGRNPQGGGAAPQDRFAQGSESATPGEAAPHGRADGSSLSLYA